MSNDTAAERRERLKEKVAKLLAKAEDAENAGRIHEAEAFYDKGFELMAEYGIEDVLLRGEEASVKREASSLELRFKGVPYAMRKINFLHRIANALHCDTVRWGTERVVVYGLPEHLDRVQMLWDMLLPQLERGVAMAYPKSHNSPGEVRVFKSSWIVGFADAITERLSQQETAAAKEYGVVALYQSDAELGKALMRREHPNLRMSYTRLRRSDEGFGAGRAAGERATMNHQMSNRQRALTA